MTRTMHDGESQRSQHAFEESNKTRSQSPSSSPLSPSLSALISPEKPIQSKHLWSTSDFYFGRQIGQGIDGNVYHARWKTSQQRSSHFTALSSVKKSDLNVSADVAIKVMDRNELVKRKRTTSVMTEKKILSRFTTDISSPWIIQLYMSFMDAQNLYLVLEYLPVSLSYMVRYFAGSKRESGGGSAHNNTSAATEGHQQRQVEEICMDVSSVQYYSGQLLCALEHLHSWGVIHRDLKPENILLTCRGRIKLIDFGSALDSRAATRGRGVCDPETFDFVGTADYVSPEVIKGNISGMGEDEGRIPPSTIDLWSYGCVVYFMFLGESPFHSESDNVALCRVLAHASGMQRVVWPAMLPLQASSLISQLLQDPNSRLGVMDKVSTLGDLYLSVRAHKFFRGVNWDDLGISSLMPPPSHSPQCMNLRECDSGDRMVDGSSLDFDFFS